MGFLNQERLADEGADVTAMLERADAQVTENYRKIEKALKDVAMNGGKDTTFEKTKEKLEGEKRHI